MPRAAANLILERRQGPVTAKSSLLDNGAIAELLAKESEQASGHLQRALRRAARSAFVWPIQAATLLQTGRSLTELASIGPYLEKLLRRWIEDPPVVPKPPPVRRNFLTLAEAGDILASNPAWARRLKGDLQMHSTWSDGAGTILEMAQAAEARGYEYIAITDHSKGLKIAGGIDEAALSRQAEEIKSVNEQLAEAGNDARVLSSVELNLNPEGKGDMDPKSLRKLDLGLGSSHSALRRKEDQTARFVAALRNPDIQILGHPRGRVYNYRIGLTADWRQVFGLAAELGKAVEVDSYADRQDLDVELLILAREAGVNIAIDTDAHSPDQLEFVRLGLAAALLAGIPAERIINFKSRDTLLARVDEVRS